MKRIKKRLLPVLLSLALCINGVSGSYQVANAAAIAGLSALEVLQGILLSFGISVFTVDMIDRASNTDWWTDGSSALQPYYDDLEVEYNKERFRVINGGGGDPQPSPTPDPGGTPEPVPTPSPDDIPEFSKLVDAGATAGFIDWTQDIWDCMGKAVSKVWDKIMEPLVSNGSMQTYDPTMFGGDNSIPSYMHEIGHVVCYYNNTGIYSYYTVFASTDVSYISYTDNQSTMGAYTKDGKSVSGVPYIRVMRRFNDKVDYYDGVYFIGNNLNGNRMIYSFNVPMRLNGTMEYPKPTEKKENIWVHPDLQNTYQNNGKLEYPQQAPQPLNIPTADQLQELARKLNPEINTEFSPEMAPSYIAELIRQLQRNPDPGTDPDPGGNPDPGGDPDPGTDPKPTGAPEPTPGPDGPDKDDVGNYTADLTKIFPFCIPFDLVHLFQVLDAEPEAPVFEIPIDIEFSNPFTGGKLIDYHYMMKIDFSEFDSIVKILRTFEIVFFLVGLMLITRQQMIKG